MSDAAKLTAQVKADGGASADYTTICKTEADCMNELKSASQPAAVIQPSQTGNGSSCPPDQPNCHDSSSPPKGGTTTISKTPAAQKHSPGGSNGSSGSGTQQSASSAQAEASADVASCSNLKGTASVCCGNPLSCSNQLSQQDQMTLNQLNNNSANGGTANGNSGVNGYCNQMQQLGDSSGHLNNAFAAICANNQVQCQSTCQQLVQKYQQKLASCNGCSAEGIYQSAYDALNSNLSACQQLQGRAAQLGNQGIASGYNSGAGSACNSMASASPQSMGDPSQQQAAAAAAANSNDPYGCQSNPNSPACMSCAQNPTMPGCQPAQQNTGQAGFTTPQAQPTASDFNVGDPSAGPQAQTQFPQIKAQQAAQVKRIANNTGGGIPGGDGGGGSYGGSHAGASGGAVSMGSGYTTDIMQGFRSGGYSEPSSSANGMQPQGFGNRVGANGSNGSNGSKMAGLDLKQFLPGAKNSPFRFMRGPAGLAMSPTMRQIMGPTSNMWNHVTQMMSEKCRLGVLFDCWSGHAEIDPAAFREAEQKK